LSPVTPVGYSGVVVGRATIPWDSPRYHRATVVVGRNKLGITVPRHVLRSRQSGTRMAFPLSRSNLTEETRRATRPDETEVL